MIGYVEGKLISLGEKYAIIDVNGVGYRVAISEKNRNILSNIGDKVKFYTHFTLNPRDGSVELYGFNTPEELNFFELLTTVSGIGPKSAQSILSSVDLATLQLGIIQGDHKYLSKTASIGLKTAQRLILELKNKVITIGESSNESGRNLALEGEAADALMTLGYSQHQAIEALKSSKEATTIEEKITNALKILGK
ncbi:MAG: Holliday junction branch migration protein RuvA [Candidatus Yanofskybacteria bacterium CG10_big_fil_rev_8_21_14_0_10_36_16]|uniref:Holliday junction branch migration complex subunit RuvA n=1 Tax=Candidatus Yanofskybacteria bacterium CG10_big_fil_rev_8_21_14_0_10_36_16 TaxID=1975096 RepID=A0A2J0Q8I5_9BACT|nr:MAG: Holliday junction branch migration protein RuvA [Candidatus Yanofskybacteria bacterium CG10_big_fil_rev_8_21_14_0_10_36_16]